MAIGRLKLAGLHDDVRNAARWSLYWADYYRVPVTVTSGFRDWDEQARLRRNYEACRARGEFGRTPACQFPANAPGDSAHNWGLAWDSVTDPAYQNWWNTVRALAGFKILPNDIIHAEVPRWRDYVPQRG